jgi:hypothetical protein
MDGMLAFCALQETVDNTGKRDALEIVYMKFFAYNGPYRPFGVIPTRTLGAHDRYCLSCFVLLPPGILLRSSPPSMVSWDCSQGTCIVV